MKANGVKGEGAATEDEDVDEDEDIRHIPRVAPPPPLTAQKPTTISNNSLVKENERLKKQLAAVCVLLLSPLEELMVGPLDYHRTRRCYAEIRGARAAATI